MAEVDACIAEVSVVLSEAWEGDFKAVHARVAAAVDAGLASNGRLASLVDLATEMLKQSKPGELLSGCMLAIAPLVP